MLILFLDLAAVSASFVPGPETNTSRQRHAPLYGRLVAEEHLPASHRDAVHQVRVYCRLSVCVGVCRCASTAPAHQHTHPAHFDLIALQPPVLVCHPIHTHKPPDIASLVQPNLVNGHPGHAGPHTDPLSRSHRRTAAQAQRGSHQNVQAHQRSKCLHSHAPTM